MNKQKNYKCETCKEPCFVNLYCSDEWKKRISEHKENLFFKEQQPIIFENNFVNGIYFIYSGEVKVYKKTSKDNIHILRIASNGNILGHRGYGKDLRYPISADSLSDCNLCFIETSVFFEMVKANGDLGFHLAMFYASELKQVENRFFNFSIMSVKERIISVLHDLSTSHGKLKQGKLYIDTNITRSDIASLAATTYASAIRVLAELVQNNLLEIQSNNMIILDPEKLFRT